MSLDPMQNGPAHQDGQSGQGATGGQGGDFDYQRAYSELRPEYTRTTQALSEYEQLFQALSDPDTQAEALAALGLELASEAGPQGTSDDEFVDPLEQELEALRAQVSELSSARELEVRAAEEAQTVQMRDDYIGEYLTYLEKEVARREFDEREEEVLGNLAIAMTGEDGIPNVQGAFERLYGSEGVLELQRQQWIDSKRGAYSAPLGSSIPADQRPQTKSERVAYIDERMRALEDQR